jgi:hypothetical protein
MFGWEFPPHVSGGLGTACFGITKALVGLGHTIFFVIPKILGEAGQSHVELISTAIYRSGKGLEGSGYQIDQFNSKTLSK